MAYFLSYLAAHGPSQQTLSTPVLTFPTSMRSKTFRGLMLSQKQNPWHIPPASIGIYGSSWQPPCVGGWEVTHTRMGNPVCGMGECTEWWVKGTRQNLSEVGMAP